MMTAIGMAQRIIDEQGYIVVATDTRRERGEICKEPLELYAGHGSLESHGGLVIVAVASREEFSAQSFRFAGRSAMNTPERYFYRVVAE